MIVVCLGNSGEACLELTTRQAEQTTTLTASPVTSQPTGLVITSDVLSCCSGDALRVILGDMLVNAECSG